MNTLDKICAAKRTHIAMQCSAVSLSEIKDRAKAAPPPVDFIKSLKVFSANGGIALIAEIKKASPSKGIIREDFDPVEIARAYEIAGAACISVLTDVAYFQGCDDYLCDIKKAISLPVLRKDFMIDPYQIYESRALGADCILLIMAALEDSLARELYDLAGELGMGVLVELHDKKELERALDLNPAMIGVNARNLKTLKVDLQTTRDMVPLIPDSILKIAESGIGSNKTIKDLQHIGYRAFLVGESLMRQDNIEEAVRNLITK